MHGRIAGDRDVYVSCCEILVDTPASTAPSSCRCSPSSAREQLVIGSNCMVLHRASMQVNTHSPPAYRLMDHRESQRFSPAEGLLSDSSSADSGVSMAFVAACILINTRAGADTQFIRDRSTTTFGVVSLDDDILTAVEAGRSRSWLSRGHDSGPTSHHGRIVGANDDERRNPQCPKNQLHPFWLVRLFFRWLLEFLRHQRPGEKPLGIVLFAGEPPEKRLTDRTPEE
jgi:hypothetical protein